MAFVLFVCQTSLVPFARCGQSHDCAFFTHSRGKLHARNCVNSLLNVDILQQNNRQPCPPICYMKNDSSNKDAKPWILGISLPKVNQACNYSSRIIRVLTKRTCERTSLVQKFLDISHTVYVTKK